METIVKKLVYALVSMMFVLVAFSSCNKDEVCLGNGILVSESGYSQESSQLRSVQTYYVALKYKNAYRHLAQYNGECSWTSYTLAAAAVARGNGKNYPRNMEAPAAKDYRDKINHVRGESKSTRIDSLVGYANRFDNPSYGVKVRIVTYDTFDEAVFGFLRERKYGNKKPCLFIGSSNGIGHYYILWDLVWSGKAETSYVNVTNTLHGEDSSLSSYDERRTYTNLESLLTNNVANKYNVLYFD